MVPNLVPKMVLDFAVLNLSDRKRWITTGIREKCSDACPLPAGSRQTRQAELNERHIASALYSSRTSRSAASTRRISSRLR
jgi:hypothetical protein